MEDKIVFYIIEPTSSIDWFFKPDREDEVWAFDALATGGIYGDNEEIISLEFDSGVDAKNLFDEIVAWEVGNYPMMSLLSNEEIN